MIMSIEEHIRKIVAEELVKLQQKVELVPIAEFCKAKKISRGTLWRAEKEGRVKLTRIGARVFINQEQFAL